VIVDLTSLSRESFKTILSASIRICRESPTTNSEGLKRGEEAMGAYDRLAAAKFREHKCEAEPSVPATKQEIKPITDTTFEERVRVPIEAAISDQEWAGMVAPPLLTEVENTTAEIQEDIAQFG
jgi:hypothetical protein